MSSSLSKIRLLVEHCPLDMQQWREEIIPFCAWLEKEILLQDRDSTIIEIGTGVGGLTLIWAQMADRVISVDNTDPTSYLMRMTRLILHQRAGCHLTVLNGKSQEATTLELARRLVADGSKVDLLFIDGDHSYEGVKADYVMWSPLVRPGGVIAFHDINAKQHPGVRELCDEIDADPNRGLRSSQVFSVDGEWGGIFAVVKG